jgi:hypothetical protein
VPDPASTEPVFGRYAVGKELPKIWPLGLVEDADDSMWMGSLNDGLFHVTNGRVEAFTQKDGLPGNHCVPVYRDDSGALWIVAQGLLSRRAGGRFQNVSEKDGLPKDVFLDLIEDDWQFLDQRQARHSQRGWRISRAVWIESTSRWARDGC